MDELGISDHGVATRAVSATVRSAALAARVPGIARASRGVPWVPHTVATGWGRWTETHRRSIYGPVGDGRGQRHLPASSLEPGRPSYTSGVTPSPLSMPGTEAEGAVRGEWAIKARAHQKRWGPHSSSGGPVHSRPPKSAALHSTALRSTPLHSTPLHSTPLHSAQVKSSQVKASRVETHDNSWGGHSSSGGPTPPYPYHLMQQEEADFFERRARVEATAGGYMPTPLGPAATTVHALAQPLTRSQDAQVPSSQPPTPSQALSQDPHSASQVYPAPLAPLAANQTNFANYLSRAATGDRTLSVSSKQEQGLGTTHGHRHTAGREDDTSGVRHHVGHAHASKSVRWEPGVVASLASSSRGSGVG